MLILGGSANAQGDGLQSNWDSGCVAVGLDVDSASLEALKQDDREYAAATVRLNGAAYTNVGVRLKGMGGFRQLDGKASFAVKLNAFAKGQKWKGASKILLNNCAQDASLMSEAFCNGLFREAGLPAPRTGFARVTFNGRDLGIYSVVEAINEPFLKREFGDGDGNLYEGVAKDITDGLEQDNGEPSDQSDLKALAEAASIANVDERWQRLQEVLDVQRFIKFVAMEVLVWHWDGYTMNRCNYRVYGGETRKRLTEGSKVADEGEKGGEGEREARGSSKSKGPSSNAKKGLTEGSKEHAEAASGMVFIPHGLDQTFRDPLGSIWPEMTSLVVRGVLQTPEGRKRYRQRLGELATNLFEVAAITNRLERLRDQVRNALKAGPAGQGSLMTEWETAFGAYKRQVLRRVESVHAQLAQPQPVPPNFDGAGVAVITGWTPKTDWEYPELVQTNLDGKAVLKVRANGPSGGSWRTRVFLEPGQYRFEAKVKTEEVVPIQDGQPPGAGVRLSGAQRQNKALGNQDWTVLAHEFSVWAQDIELVLELRATEGQAFFALDSLRLSKIR
jgi:spore coat protein H